MNKLNSFTSKNSSSQIVHSILENEEMNLDDHNRNIKDHWDAMLEDKKNMYNEKIIKLLKHSLLNKSWNWGVIKLIKVD